MEKNRTVNQRPKLVKPLSAPSPRAEGQRNADGGSGARPESEGRQRKQVWKPTGRAIDASSPSSLISKVFPPVVARLLSPSYA
jgi:hypothetical protein